MKKFKLTLFFLYIILCVSNLYSQDTIMSNDSTRVMVTVKKDVENKINDVIQPYGWIDYSAEYYTVDSRNS